MIELDETINSVTEDYDLCFRGINLSGAILAMAALKSGLKVAIVIDKPLNWNFEPEITTLYPLQIRKIFQSVRSIKYFEKIASYFPELVYPQRILIISEERKFRAKAIFLFDFLLKRDRETASLPINFSKFPAFQLLANLFQNGLLVQEFRFDRNMAIIKMLLKCKDLGANIVNGETNFQLKRDAKSLFTCLPSQHKKSEIKIENIQLNFNNNLRVVAQNIEMTTRFWKSTTFFHFKSLRFSDQHLLLDKVFYLLKAIGVESPEKYQKELTTIFNDFEPEISLKQEELNLISDPEISNFEKSLNGGMRKISNATGKRIRFKKMIKGLKYNKFEWFSLQKLQANCDEKFDLAKQTGIEYRKFSYYFYRYHDCIDDLIELAYQEMNENRTDPQLVWENVEKEFQKLFENEIFC